jgi:hypothetical protein
MTSEEKDLAKMYHLDAQQIYWRRLKLSEMGDPKLFCREYPATPTEAFVSADFDSFLPIDDVMRARKVTDIEPHGALILGVDIARKGADSTCIAWRKGRVITKTEKYRDLDLMQVAGLVAKIIREEKPEKVFCDSTGLGVGVVDRLQEQGYSEVVAVNFSSKPVEVSLDEMGRPAGGAANRRAELYLNLRNALAGQLKIPDSDALAADLTATGFKYDSQGRVQLEEKSEVKKRLGASPDQGDAVALTFAIPIGAPPSRASNFNRVLHYPRGSHYA